MIKISEVQQLQETVIDGGYCIGCGACAAVKDSPFKVEMDVYGCYTAKLEKKEDVNKDVEVLKVCPFSGHSKNENELGDIYFPNNVYKSNHIGNYIKCFAGHVNQGLFREKGSSGGMGKWLGQILLKEKEIDYLIHVVGNSTSDANVPLFDYQIVSDPEEVVNGSKSSYYPTTLDKVLQVIESKPGRYAITGVPCFVKAIRLLCLDNPLLKDRIRFTMGIVCGGMKSANQSKMIGWQLGVHPDNLVAIDFRGKDPSKPASRKIYQVWSNRDNLVRSEATSKIHGTDYGASFFKPNACDYCDDVVGETADVSFGDAWLPQYVNDSKGTSIVVVRNQIILDIIEKYRQSNLLLLDEIEGKDVVKSQEGGFRHRREALSFRLGKKEKIGEWYPKKRVAPNEFEIDKKRRKIYQLREDIASRSHIQFYEALKKNDFNHFLKKMVKIEGKYFNLVRGTKFQRKLRRIQELVTKFFKK